MAQAHNLDKVVPSRAKEVEMSTPTRDTSPVRPPTSSGAQEPVTPQRGSPPPVPTGVATAFGPQGYIPDPWVRGDSSGAGTSVDSNGASGFFNVAAAGVGQVPISVLHIYIHTYIYTYIRIMNIYIYIYINIYIYIYIYIFIYLFIYVC